MWDGLIAPGEIDERDIRDVTPGDLRGFRQCHFFAGIGVWSYALRRADWPDGRPVWTGSCPCQPFSSAGRGSGFADERHLWPAFHWLIAQCRPAVLFGEQVASAAAGPWIDLVHADLEAMGYTFGCVPFPSAGVGAPHIRDRAFWVADTGTPRLPVRERQAVLGARGREEGRAAEQCGGASAGGVAHADGRQRNGVADGEGCQRDGSQAGRVESDSLIAPSGAPLRPGPVNGQWRDADWLFCRDGKWRPVEPGTFPLAHGAPARVGRLRAYGNAINAEAAAEFIRAYLDAAR